MCPNYLSVVVILFGFGSPTSDFQISTTSVVGWDILIKIAFVGMAFPGG